MKHNLIKLLIEILLLVLSILGLVKESISMCINGSCIMLQNYNIDRVEKYIAGPYQKRKEKIERKAVEYVPLTEVTSKVIDKSDGLPTPSEMLASLTTDEQKELFLKLVRQELKYRKRKEETSKVKILSK